MSLGRRIKQIRLFRGLTQKALGKKLGFSDSTADVRVAQYESDKKYPQPKMIEKIANSLEVTPIALDTPNVNTEYGVMHTLFSLEDYHGLEPVIINGQPHVKFGSAISDSISQRILEWAKEKQKLENGEITQQEYDEWRYNYPASVAKQHKLTMDNSRK